MYRWLAGEKPGRKPRPFIIGRVPYFLKVG